jgi:predicted MFS family arabinose efflux permease
MHPTFRPLAFANLAAQSAEQICLAAVPIVAVLVLGAGPAEVGLLAAVQTLPFLLLSIPAGLATDRVSRKRLMLGAEAARAGSLLAMLAAALGGWLSVPLLAVLGFIGATGTVAFSVAAPALVSTLVPREELGRANSALELARSLAYAGGPALAGALVSWAGGSAAFVLATVLSAAAALLLVKVHEPVRAPAPPRQVLAELREGIGFILRHPVLRAMLWTTVAWNLGWFVLQAVYVPHAAGALGLSARGIGFTLAAFGGGMVLGALAAPRVMARLPFGGAMLVGPAASVLASTLMLATVAWPSGWLAAAAFVCFGAGPIIWTITTTTLRQAITPPGMLGRVTSMFLTANMGARPFGAALGGLAGEGLGIPGALALSTGAFVLQMALIGASPVRAMKTLPGPGPSTA